MKLFKLILLLMLVSSLIPTAIVGINSVTKTREMLIRDAQELAQERVKQIRSKTETILEQPGRAAMSLAKVNDFLGRPIAEQRSLIGSILNQRREITILTLYSADKQRVPGLQVFAVQDVPPTEVAEHEERAEAMLTGLHGLRYSKFYLSKARTEPVVTLAFPLSDPPKGYVAAEVSLSELTSMLADERVGSTGFAYVTDEQGRLVAGPGVKLPIGSDLTARPVIASALKSARESNILHVGNFGEGDDRVVGAYSTLPDLGWTIASEQPIELAYLQVQTMERQIAAGVAGAIFVAFLLAAFFSRTLSRPIRRLDSAARELAGGKFGAQVKVETKNGLGDLAQTFNYMSMQISAFNQENTRLYESLENGYLETIVALANSIDSKDSYTRGHSQRVGDTAVEIGREMGLSDRELKLLHYGGILHDVGKIGIVDAILCKQSRLTDEEMTVMREHPAIGDNIISSVSFLEPVRSAVRSHHERWDGTGYPDQLKGDAIPLIARIVNAADTFDACTSTRPYQKAMPLEKAIEILENLRSKQLDPNVVDALKRVIEKKGLKVESGHSGAVKLAG